MMMMVRMIMWELVFSYLTATVCWYTPHVFWRLPPRCIALFFNCSKFSPRGTITLIQRVVSAKLSDWSEDALPTVLTIPTKRSLALMVGVPTLVGIISEIMSNTSCFSAVFHYHVYYSEANFSLHMMLRVTAAHTFPGCLLLHLQDPAVKCVCEKFNSLQTVWTVVVTLVPLSQQDL